MEQKKKNHFWRQHLGTVCFMLLGGACGIVITRYLDAAFSFDASPLAALFYALILLLVMYLAIFTQMILHEAGHLIFGLLSGYQFSSFRIMSFILVKEDGKFKLRRFRLAGTGGQCLMSPPELSDGKIPVILYNLGGCIVNILAGLAFWGLYVFSASTPFASTMFLLFAVVGFGLAAMNGIPMRLGTVDNDGYNALSLRKNKAACYAFWVELKANAQTALGVRLKDMPEAWFVVPKDEELKNCMTATLGVLACNRLVDEHKFEEANALITHLLQIDSGIVGLHRSLLICDRTCCRLLADIPAGQEEMQAKEQLQFMKAMKNHPSVIRTQCIVALLQEKDAAKAEALQKSFEKQAKCYPYPNEVQSERELMEIAKQKTYQEV